MNRIKNIKSFVTLLTVSALLACALLLSACISESDNSAPVPIEPNNEETQTTTPDATTSDGTTPDATPPDTTTTTPAGPFPFAFAAEDLYGNLVTEESLGEKQLFFVHFWATWCPPCVAEMPDLAKIAEDYADEVGFIALLADYSDNLEGAQNLAESAGIPGTFIMIDANTPELAPLLAMLQTGYVPTSIVLNSDGELVEQQLIGAYGEKYAEILDLLLH
ncbi:MAG: TlpA family protein disulfide reductase [Oscillospiraceae bacterium]|nr:TlpA family protein disulfide reductase [Oscillospiraceae bacterium]